MEIDINSGEGETGIPKFSVNGRGWFSRFGHEADFFIVFNLEFDFFDYITSKSIFFVLNPSIVYFKISFADVFIESSNK